jgi:SSS family solute:Na+ symporter
MTSPPDEEQLEGLTYATNEAAREEIRASWNSVDVLATIVILGLVAAVYGYFSFWAS